MPVDPDSTARLMEALLVDPALRERFRRDPVGTCREAGLDDLADEMAEGAGKAAYTLDLRESKSSLAGLLMAAAVEGIAVWQVLEHAGRGGEIVGSVLSRVSLPAMPALPDVPALSDFALPGGAAPPHAAVGGALGAGAAAGSGGVGGASGGGVAGGVGGGAAAAPADPASMLDPSDAGAGGGATDGKPGGGGVAGAGKAGGAAKDSGPGRAGSAASQDGGASPLRGSGGGGDAAVAPSPIEPVAPPAVVAAPAPAVDLAAHPNISADGALQAGLQAGQIDGRSVGALAAASGGHQLTVVASQSAPGAIEITAVDGQPVDESNMAARDLAVRLGSLDPALRPATIGTPWAIGGAGFATGPALQDRLQIGFGGGASGAGGGGASTLTMGAVKGHAAGARRTDSLVLGAQQGPAKQAAVVAEPLAAAPAGRVPYPGDHASKAQYAAWLAAEARHRGLPAELPVMASLVESGLANLSGGDRDSVGFFQMRVGIWNTGDYAGYPSKPHLQAKWFLDQAEAVKKQRVARGQSITDPHQFGDWIADVERPAEEYRGRYQERLEQAQALLRQARSAPSAAPSGVAGAAAGEPQAVRAATTPSVGDAVSAAAAHGGHGATPEALAALQNKRLHFDASGIRDLKAGKIDPRIIAILTRLSRDHEITVSCMRSDHSQFTTGGSVSNHFHGRGIDIAAIDGHPVGPGNPLAKEVAYKLANLNAKYRPDEVGSPFEIADPAYFTDGAHQNHIHIGFDAKLPKGWQPPASVAAGGGELAARAAVAGGGVPGAPAAGGAAPGAAGAGVPGSDTLALRAPRARDAAGPGGPGSGSGGDKPRPDTLQLSTPKAPEPAAQQAALGGAAAGVPGAGAAAGVAGGPGVAGVPGVPGAPAGVAGSAVVGDAGPGGAGPGQVAAAAADLGHVGGAGPRALAAVHEARKYLGTDYQWGGASPKTGFDCSGLVQWAYAKQGIRIPRVTYDQIDAPGAKHVGRHNLRPGDLIFFAAGGDVHHVAMSLGGDRFIHAPHTGDVVKVSKLTEPYYAQQFAGGRRFDQSTPVAAVARGAAVADPVAVRAAEEARVADEVQVANPQSLIFKALTKQEAANHQHTLQFLAAIKPQEARRVADGAVRAGLDTPIEAAAGASQAAGGYPGDGASKGEMARWLAAQARKHGLPPELPVMASLVESGLQNLRGGDRDSVGFFQMRVGIWNKGAYAGYQDRPELQAKWFIDQALAVKRARLASGDQAFGRDPSTWGAWVADVERPAEQYRGRYQVRLAEARKLLRG